jgi:hypothetical protein
MSEDPAKKAQPAKDSPTAVMHIRDLRKMISDQVTEAMKAVQSTVVGTPDPTPPATDPRQAPRMRAGQQRNVADEVSAALDKIERDKADQEWRTGLDKDLTELKERTKEKPPVERSRLHRIMGWGE